MENNTITLKFQEAEVRFVGTAERPEWVAADILDILYADLDKRNRSNLLKKVPDDWKGSSFVMTPGGKQKMTTVLEAGAYRLIARSNSPLAIPFQRWLFEEVLPSIRKTGAYSVPGAVDAHDPVIQSLQAALEVRKKQIEHEKRIDSLEGSVGGILDDREAALRQIESLDIPEGEAPEKTDRARLNQLIRLYAQAHNIPYEHLWRKLYMEVYSRLHLNPRKRAQRVNKAPLDILEELGVMGSVLRLAAELFPVNDIEW